MPLRFILRPGRSRSRYRPALAGMMCLALAACGGANGGGTNGSDDYYDGRTIRIIVPVAAGSGVDIAARLFAEHLAPRIEGDPSVQVVNVDGGGDGRIGANEFAAADPNGETLLAAASDTHERPLFSDLVGVDWDFSKMTPIIGTQTGSVITVRTETGITSIDDLVNYGGELFYGGTGASGGFLVRTMGLDMLGVEFESLLGYSATNAIVTSFEQGETNIYGFSTSAYLRDGQALVDAGVATPLMTTGVLQDDEVVHDDEFPDLPSLDEVYEEVHGEPPSGELWEAFKFYMATQFTLDQCIYVSSDAPPEATEALQAAADELAQDEEFLAEAESVLGGYPILYGDSLRDMIQDVLVDFDPAVRDFLIQYVKDKHQVDLATDF